MTSSALVPFCLLFQSRNQGHIRPKTTFIGTATVTDSYKPECTSHMHICTYLIMWICKGPSEVFSQINFLEWVQASPIVALVADLPPVLQGHSLCLQHLLTWSNGSRLYLFIYSKDCMAVHLRTTTLGSSQQLYKPNIMQKIKAKRY